MDELQFWTLVIAAGGFVTAIISLLWNVFLHSVNKPKIRVTASISRMHPTPIGLAKDTDIFVIEAVNLRSRSVTIVSFCGEFLHPKKGKEQFFINGSSKELQHYASSLPCQLKEGERANLFQIAGFRKEVKYFFAFDTTGRRWKSKKHPLRKWLKESRKPNGQNLDHLGSQQ